MTDSLTPKQTEIVVQIRKLLNKLSKSEQPRKQRRVVEGHPNGPPPFGFSSQPRTAEEKRKRISKPLVPNETEQDILNLAKSLRELDISYAGIATSLNANGYRTRSGGPWALQGVARILGGKAE